MQFNPEKRGQGLVEYAFIMMLVALLVIVVVALFGEAIENMDVTILAGI
jgi:pilus assembly protein Flp/PilA